MKFQPKRHGVPAFTSILVTRRFFKFLRHPRVKNTPPERHPAAPRLLRKFAHIVLDSPGVLSWIMTCGEGRENVFLGAGGRN